MQGKYWAVYVVFYEPHAAPPLMEYIWLNFVINDMGLASCPTLPLWNKYGTRASLHKKY